MPVFRESRRTRNRRKKARRRQRSDRSLGAGRVSSRRNPNRRSKKTSAIAKVMLATEFGNKQGGIQRIGSAIQENRLSEETDAKRTWNQQLDPFNIEGFFPPNEPPLHPPAPPKVPPSGGFQGFRPRRKPGFRGKGASAVRPRAPVPTAGSAKLVAFLGIAASIGAGAATLWWIGQSSKGGNDTSTQLMLNFLEEVHYAIYIDNKLISVVDQDCWRQFKTNMKRNLQLRTRGLRSD